MEQKQQKQGYTIVTYRVRLYDKHFFHLVKTKSVYEKVILHFLYILQKEPNLLAQSDFSLLRTLEVKCIGTKEMKAEGVLPEYPLKNLPKIPLYFRRSAINAAIDLARKHIGKAGERPVTTKDVTHYPMILYKGMYQNFTDNAIELKVFQEGKWVWITYRFSGRAFPKEAKKLSPMLFVDGKQAWLDVPISIEVSDIRTVKERMQEEKFFCAVSFPDNDALAVAVIMTREGKEVEHLFFRGGKAKEAKRKKILKQIQKSKCSRGTEQEAEKENAHWYKKLHEVNRYYAHTISKQILDYCLERNIKLIVVPNYEKSIDFHNKQYLKTDVYRWLGRSIMNYLRYKAFQNGIVVTSVRPYHIADRCSECGAVISKYNEGHHASKKYYGGKLFLCPNGHKGNTAWNTAKNVGKRFLEYYE